MIHSLTVWIIDLLKLYKPPKAHDSLCLETVKAPILPAKVPKGILVKWIFPAANSFKLKIDPSGMVFVQVGAFLA